MSVEEKGFNTHLGIIISKTMPCEAENKQKDGSQPDFLIKPNNESETVVMEAKIGISATNKKAAVKDAQKKLKGGYNYFAAAALCYPTEIKQKTNADEIKTFLEKTDELQWVEVNTDDIIGNWKTGTINDLLNDSKHWGKVDVDKIAKQLGVALIESTKELTENDKKEIAEVLNLPVDPKAKTYNNAAKIGALLLANGMLFHSRLHSAGVLPNKKIPSFGNCFKSQKIKLELEKAWESIQEIDYYPIFAPAATVLDALPDDSRSQNMLKMLGRCVQTIANQTSRLPADFVGRLYHHLLDTARYDGSFYTSTPAAFLLARLALSDDFMDWSDREAISRLKICDPSCGTGTLLLAASATILEKHREALPGVDQLDLDFLHLALAEDVLIGLDINFHAIHLAASMIAMANPKVDFNRMQLYRLAFGVERLGRGTAELGSLELLDSAKGKIGQQSMEFGEQKKVGGEAEKVVYPDLLGKCDLVIMNPPFTRDSLRHNQFSREDELAMKSREKRLLEQHPDGEVVHRSGNSAFFVLLANELNRKQETGNRKQETGNRKQESWLWFSHLLLLVQSLGGHFVNSSILNIKLN